MLNRSYPMSLTASLLLAYASWVFPQRQMPLNYDFMVSRSIPLAIVWAMLLIFSLWRYEKRGLGLLLGIPMALYWPIWLLFNHFPQCYYMHNCQ
jgi:hypothetical protein